ncbi:maltokinase [Streptomyces sp. NPDC060194]|uniref:maltokinase N-terminal cap-like domain-containing protein n=1 Tax=Streptomyces sp. NPDC060194 TaxID=3347069 RepID=UPI003649F02A
MLEASARSRALHRPGPPVVESLDPLLRAWLPRQRWFAGKGRPITGFRQVAATELLPHTTAPGLLHLLVEVEPEPADCYQLLLGVTPAAAPTLPPHLAHAVIGRVDTGPLAGLTVYEALLDPRLTGLLLERLRTPGSIGTLRFGRDLRSEIPDGPDADTAPRTLGAEQSNSSIVYGDSLILKFLRRVQPGINPDLELPLALAREGCARVPAPTAWFTHEAGDTGPDDSYTLGVLQPFLHGAEDGWELALDTLAADGDFLAEAHALGRATAEVHTALAAAMPVVTLGRAQLEQLAEGMTERLESTAAAVPALQPYTDALRGAFEDVGRLGADGTTAVAQRVHGDLHLGQCLRTGPGLWSIIDFEGEPARPIAERRLPQPAVRDVAGMLRSFDYAARSHTPWAPDWAARCRRAYCEGYAESSGDDPRDQQVLLRAYETDKAVYEVLYEARHRPDWLTVPMAAIRRLAAAAETKETAPSRRPTP